MFTEIGIRNFKAFHRMQHVPLKPITLLYGPNSSGKSTLLQSFLLLKQTLEESGNEEIVLLPKGSHVDLGGYQEFINGHNTAKDFSLAFSFMFHWSIIEWGYDYQYVNEEDNLSLEFSFFQDNRSIFVKSIQLRDTINSEPIAEWKNIWEIPSLRRKVMQRKAKYEKDGEDSETIKNWLLDLERSALVLDYINMSHNFIKENWASVGGGYTKEKRENQRGGVMNIARQNAREINNIKKFLLEEKQRLHENKEELESRRANLSKEDLDEEIERLEVEIVKYQQMQAVLKLLKTIDKSFSQNSYDLFSNNTKYPCSDRLMQLSHCFPDDSKNTDGTDRYLFQNIPDFARLGDYERHNLHAYAYSTLNPKDLLYYATQLLKEYLRRIIYIGPIREYPERVYAYSGNLLSNVGKSGRYTPDILLNRPDLVAKVNEWFERFEIGYALKIDILKRDLFSLSLVDKLTGHEVSPKDVGFGISQLLPILVQGIISEKNIIFIEQPEIHVHPRLQAELGSFLAECVDKYESHRHGSDYPPEPGNQFIIETHSEHLVLRLLRLIRDTTNGELKESEKPLRPEDVAVIYAKPTEHGTELVELRISKDGDFIDPWPEGFFTEREKELF